MLVTSMHVGSSYIGLCSGPTGFIQHTRVTLRACRPRCKVRYAHQAAPCGVSALDAVRSCLQKAWYTHANLSVTTQNDPFLA